MFPRTQPKSGFGTLPGTSVASSDSAGVLSATRDDRIIRCRIRMNPMTSRTLHSPKRISAGTAPPIPTTLPMGVILTHIIPNGDEKTGCTSKCPFFCTCVHRFNGSRELMNQYTRITCSPASVSARLPQQIHETVGAVSLGGI